MVGSYFDVKFLESLREVIRAEIDQRAAPRDQQATTTAAGVRKIVREEIESRPMMSGGEWNALGAVVAEQVERQLKMIPLHQLVEVEVAQQLQRALDVLGDRLRTNWPGKP